MATSSLSSLMEPTQREQHVRQLLVAALRLVDAGELGEHQRLVGAHAARGEQRGQRVLLAPQPLVHLADLQVGGRGLGAQHLGLGGERGEQLLGAALALGHALHRGEQQQVLAVQREGLAEARGGGLAAA